MLSSSIDSNIIYFVVLLIKVDLQETPDELVEPECLLKEEELKPEFEGQPPVIEG